MADDAVLLADRAVGLVVFVAFGPEVLRVLAAGAGLGVEIVRLAAALVDEVRGEVEVAAVAGEAVELDEGELDLLVAVVAALLAGAGAEGGADVGDVALEDVEEAAAAGGEEVGDAAFEEVAEVVELVVVAEVGPALVGLAAEVPGVEVAVRAPGRGRGRR